MKINEHYGSFGSRVTVISDLALIKKALIEDWEDEIIDCVTISSAKNGFFQGLSTIIYDGNATKPFIKKEPQIKLLYRNPRKPTEEQKFLFDKSFNKEEIMEVHSIVVDMFKQAVENKNNYSEVFEKIIKTMPYLKVRVEIPKK